MPYLDSNATAFKTITNTYVNINNNNDAGNNDADNDDANNNDDDNNIP